MRQRHNADHRVSNPFTDKMVRPEGEVDARIEVYARKREHNCFIKP